jgi:hypothetical protein
VIRCAAQVRITLLLAFTMEKDADGFYTPSTTSTHLIRTSSTCYLIDEICYKKLQRLHHLLNLHQRQMQTHLHLLLHLTQVCYPLLRYIARTHDATAPNNETATDLISSTFDVTVCAL